MLAASVPTRNAAGLSVCLGAGDGVSHGWKVKSATGGSRAGVCGALPCRAARGPYGPWFGAASPRQEEPLDAGAVPHGDLGVGSHPETAARVDLLTFGEDAPDRVEG